jgi:hypothetical protein
MNRRIVLILGVVFIALAVITYLQNRPAPITPAPEDQFESFVGRDLNMTVLDIQAIRLRDPKANQSFVISRDATGNWIAPESEGSLDKDTASNIAKTVVLMPYKQTVALTDDTNLTQFGFQPDGTLLVDVVLSKSNNGHVIAAGGLSPDGMEYYVLIDDIQQVFLIQRGPIDYLKSLLSKPPLT